VKTKPHRRSTPAAKQRTTLTLPAESLAQARSIAQARRVNLSVVISEALSEGLRQNAECAKFSEDEILVLDGVILGPAGKS
jgi:post-segregation antitoxin (ccd killing protein)